MRPSRFVAHGIFRKNVSIEGRSRLPKKIKGGGLNVFGLSFFLAFHHDLSFNPKPRTHTRPPSGAMAFFGLTALGMDRPLAVGADRVHHLHVFDDSDWAAAWEKQRRRLVKRGATSTDMGTVEAGLPIDVVRV